VLNEKQVTEKTKKMTEASASVCLLLAAALKARNAPFLFASAFHNCRYLGSKRKEEE